MTGANKNSSDKPRIVHYHEHFPLGDIDDSDEEFQQRLDYDKEEIQRLAEDIKQNGLRNPIGIQKKGKQWQLIYGFQRVKALKILGHTTAKVNVYEGLTEKEAREHSISDNVRHGDLTDIEKALECLKLKEKGYPIEQLRRLFGVKKSVIYNYLSIAKLDSTTRFCVHKEFITVNHAVELARIKDISKRLETLRDVVAWKWSVRDLKTWIKEGRGPVMKLWLTGWVPLCPKTMKAEGLETCKKCEYHKRVEVIGHHQNVVPSEIRQIGCSFPTPNEVKPLLRLELDEIKVSREYAALTHSGMVQK